jgi:tetratricopeptide (TPR) repeat protein
LALVLVTAAVYAPVRHHAFLSYDDVDYVVDNPHVTAGLTRDGLIWAWTGVHQATWHPLSTLSHMLDCQLFGLDAGWHHLGNVVLHVLNTLLLFAVFARMTAQPWRSACVAALFALHPLHVESVAWVSERKDVLSTFFGMLTLWSYVAYAKRPGRLRYAAVLAAYVAALLSKPMVVTLPFVLLLLDWWPLRRITVPENAGRVGATGRLPLRTLLLEKLPLLVLAAGVGVITVIVQNRATAVVPLNVSPLVDRLANVTLAYAVYLQHAVWPAGLAVFYPFEAPLPVWKVTAAAALLVAVSLVAWAEAGRRPYLAVGWLWYLGTLLPVIGLVRIGDFSLADRYTYVPLIGIFIMAAWGLPDLLHGRRFSRVACAAAATAAIAACGLLTLRQLRYWQDSLTLFRHALAVTRDNYVAHVNIGMALAEQGQDDEALAHVAEAVRVKPGYPVAQYALGVLLDRRGEHAAAAEHLRAALAVNPRYADAHNALGTALAGTGDRNGAMAEFREALRLNPGLVAAHDNLGVLLNAMGQHEAALVELAEGVRLAPARAEAQCNFAEALGNAGRVAEAAAHFRAALQLDPQLLRARYGLAIAAAKLGQVAEAEEAFDRVLREQPNRVPVQSMLAWLLATADDPRLRNGRRATRLAEEAVLRTNEQDPDALNSLAAAYAESGRFEEAVRVAEAALERARALGRTGLASALAERVVWYRAGQPARDLVRGTQG